MNNQLFQTLIIKARTTLDKPDSKFKHFSFIVCNNRILSVGYNNIYKTHPLAKKYGHRFESTHSEINAIAKFPYAPRCLDKCEMVNIRLNKKGEVRLSKPCKYCQKLLVAFNLDKICYSVEANQWKTL